MVKGSGNPLARHKIIHVYAPKNRDLKYMKQEWTEWKRNIDTSTIVGYFHIPIVYND